MFISIEVSSIIDIIGLTQNGNIVHLGKTPYINERVKQYFDSMKYNNGDIIQQIVADNTGNFIKNLKYFYDCSSKKWIPF